MENWQDPITPFIWLGVGVLVLFTFVIFLLLFVRRYLKNMRRTEQEKAIMALNHQKDLLAHSIAIQEKERSRIASDLHDDLISQLHRIKLMNENKELNAMIGESIHSARRISHDLSPPLLGQLGIHDLIMDFTEAFGKNFEIRLHHLDATERKLNKPDKLNIFRVYQECLTNITKHAKASIIDVYLRTTDKFTILSVKDNGVGIGMGGRKGLGLKNIELRIQLLKGKYHLKNRKTSGSTFLLVIKRDENE